MFRRFIIEIKGLLINLILGEIRDCLRNRLTLGQVFGVVFGHRLALLLGLHLLQVQDHHRIFAACCFIGSVLARGTRISVVKVSLVLIMGRSVQAPLERGLP